MTTTQPTPQPNPRATLKPYVTYWANLESVRPIDGGPKCEDYLAFVERIKSPRRFPSKATMPLVTLCTFEGSPPRGRSLRCNEYVADIFGVALDYDGKGDVPRDEVISRARATGAELVIYSTPSGGNRCRIFAFFCCPTRDRGRVAELRNKLIDALGLEVDRASRTLSQMYYVGAVEGAEYWAEHVEGAFIDELSAWPTLDATAEPALVDGGRNSYLHGEGVKLRKAGAEPDEVDGKLRELNAALPDPLDAGELERVISNASAVKPGAVATAADLYDLAALGGQAEAEAAIAKARLDERFRVLPAAEFASRPAPQSVVKGLLPMADLGVIYGESGSGKSFWALDVMLAIARGIPWRERRTKRKRVVYVCAEGAGGFRNRLTAYCQANSLRAGDLDLGVVAAAPDLLRGDHLALIGQIKAAGGADIVVIDTFSRAMPGGNENAAEDTGKAISRCGEITAATGAMVVLIHHSGKDPTRGARGWSGIKAAADVEIEITRNDDLRCATVSKSKDGEDGERFYFALEPVQIGTDEDGDTITSCIVVPANEAPKAAPREGPTGTNQKLVLRELLAMFDEAGIDPDTALSLDEAVRRCGSKLACEPRRQTVRAREAISGLTAAGHITLTDGRIRRV